MSKFCSKCGFQLEDEATFCSRCGTYVATQPQSDIQIHNQVYPPVQPYANNMQVKPKIPGRGFGIASMVLGIIGLVYSVSCLSNAASVSELIRYNEFIVVSTVIAILIFSTLSILAVCFAFASKNRGYNTNIRKSGMIMGTIGLCIYLLSIFVCITTGLS